MAPLTVTIGSGPIALVQTGAVQETIISTSSPLPGVLPVASTAGNLLLLFIGAGNPGAVPSISGVPAGFTKLAGVITAANTSWEVWGYPNNPGGIAGLQVTANCGAVGARWWTYMSEWSGVAFASILEASGTTTAAAGTTLAPTATTAVLSVGDLVISSWMQQALASAAITFTSPSGYTRLIDTQALVRFQHLDIEYATSPSVGSIVGPTLTSSVTTDSAAGLVVVLRAAHPVVDQTAYLKY